MAEITKIEKSWVKDFELHDPNHPQNNGKVTFEVRVKKYPNGSLEKSIWINGELLDYSVDISSYIEACKMGLKRYIQKDIAKHFLGAVSEVVGRRVTAEEVMTAQRTGWI